MHGDYSHLTEAVQSRVLGLESKRDSIIEKVSLSSRLIAEYEASKQEVNSSVVCRSTSLQKMEKRILTISNRSCWRSF